MARSRVSTNACWQVISAPAHFTIRTTTDPRDPRGVLYACLVGLVQPQRVTEAGAVALEGDTATRLYVITDQRVASDAPALDRLFQTAVQRVHAQPGALAYHPHKQANAI